MPSSFFIYNSKIQSLTINVLAKPSSKQNKISEALEVEINGASKSKYKILSVSKCNSKTIEKICEISAQKI